MCIRDRHSTGEVLVRSLADHDRHVVLLGQALQARGEVHGVADRPVLHALGGADVADEGVARADAHPAADGAAEAARHLPRALLQLQSGLYRAEGVVRIPSSMNLSMLPPCLNTGSV